MMMKDNTFSIERSEHSVLSVVEIFEIKTLLLQMDKISKLSEKLSFPQEFKCEDITELLDILDPGKDRLNTFYIYDSFSEKLELLRKEKKELDRTLRKTQKGIKEELKKKYGVVLNPKFELVVSKSSPINIQMTSEIEELIKTDEDYMSMTFTLAPTEETDALIKQGEQLTIEIEDEEFKVREILSRKIFEFQNALLANCSKIGNLDITLAKALYAKKHNCVMPEIVEEHVVEYEDGRHLQVEGILKAKGGEYCPVSISLKDGVTCITGANMGGKTISLKLTGMVAILAQYGYFVPCKRARVGLSNYMQILIGDSQSIERGLSSFGSEMEELKEIMDNSKDRSLILVDEIASGTNPVEGLALTRSLIDYLKTKTYITLMTTHFEAVTETEGVKNMQVMGLGNADFNKLDKEIRYANRKERIKIIGKYMDYRLVHVENVKEIPKDALNIAKMLGIDKDIIERAKEYIK
jgi:DNA mismatch repair ATPase MutS